MNFLLSEIDWKYYIYLNILSDIDHIFKIHYKKINQKVWNIVDKILDNSLKRI